MRNSIILLIFLALIACQPKKEIKHEPLKLVVLLSVDQMRFDYPDLFEYALHDGFKTLKNEGVRFKAARHLHAFAGTAQGHATVSTGCYPSHHGITANYIYNRELKRDLYSVLDTTSKIIPFDSTDEMPVSPRNLKKPSLGDIIREKNPKSKSFSLALKNRTAILMGGQDADRAYWFDGSTNQMVSSNWYSHPFPDWVKLWNVERLYAKEIEEGWLFPGSLDYVESRDQNFREKDFFLDRFPHLLSHKQFDNQPLGDFMKNTPFGDHMIFELSKEIVKKENLGADENIDVLSIGCSSADYIGHHFGPNSMEVLAYFHTLDSYIADFIRFLDDEIGRDEYLLVLTSDHGISDFPEFRGGERISKEDFQKDVDSISTLLATKYNVDADFVEFTGKDRIYFDKSKLQPLNESEKVMLSESFSQHLTRLAYVESSNTFHDMSVPDSLGKYVDYYLHSFIEDQWPDLVIHQKPYYLLRRSAYGTDHNSNYSYDTDVPLYFFAGGMRYAYIDKMVNTVDIVPTVLEILQLDLPIHVDGRSALHLIEEAHTRPSEN